MVDFPMTDLFSEELEIAALTDPGRVRDHNEDNFVIDRSVGIVAVADGMGGHSAGEIASQMALESIVDFLFEFDGTLNREDIESGKAQNYLTFVLRSAVNKANRRIYLETQKMLSRGESSMGTTVAGLQYDDAKNTINLFHVGDSRVYRYRNSVLDCLTSDHSPYQEWIESGRQGTPPQKNVILRALGVAEEVEVDIASTDILPGDQLLICSDGLNGMLDDPTIAELLAEVKPGEVEAGCQSLIDAANENGGTDNVTVILVRHN